MFDEHRTIAERSDRLTHCSFHLFLQFIFFFNQPHTFSATTCGGFYKYRIPYLFCHNNCFMDIINCFCCARNQWNFVFFCGSFCGELAAHHPHGITGWTDEDEPCGFHLVRKAGILGKKTIPRVNGIGVCFFCSIEYIINYKIRLIRRRGPDVNSLVCITYMQSIPVCFRINCNCFDSHLLRTAHHAQCNFPAVGYYYFFHPVYCNGEQI